MRTLKLTIAYDGTDFAGWQVQRGRPTVQGTLEQAFRRITRQRVRVVGSGRTDAGVHALAQIAHARLTTTLSVERLRAGLNAVLPPAIVVREVRDAPAGFHARFSARGKRYRYRIVTEATVTPFDRRYVHHVTAPLNVPLMRREAGHLLGRHDLRAFHKAGRPVSDTRRTVREALVRRRGAYLDIEFEADGFLYAMMRGIVGTLLDIGRGARPPGTMAKILRTRDRGLIGPTAPAKGLCLLRVTY